MSYRSQYRGVLDKRSKQATAIAYRLGRLVFGDYRGIFIFLLSCSAAMVLWRTTFSITDNLTVANGLVALSDGHLYVDTPTYSDTLNTPGMAEYDGRAYPRNFVHIVLALPILWGLDAVAAVADVRIALAALWSLLIFATISVGGRLAGHHRVSHLVGGAVALVSFGANVALATPFPHDRLAYPALQLATVLAAAGCALVVYRLLSDMHSSDIGLAAGIAVGIASPSLLWATIPKRHVLTALFALLTLFFLYKSRATDRLSIYRRYRVLAYVPVGLTVWLHPLEGIILLGTLFIADFTTARENGIRTLATVAVGFLVSLLPFFLTNYLISSDPFTPPRLLDRRGAEAVGTPVTESMAPSDGADSGGETGSTAESTSQDENILETIGNGTVGMIISLSDRSLFFTEFLTDSLEAIYQEPSRLYRTFIRSGYLEFSSRGWTGLAINVAFLEALSIAGALVAAPIVAFRRISGTAIGGAFLSLRSRPTFAADIFIVTYAILLTLLNIHRLPISASLTVRYVYPLFPLAVYAVVRLPWVRTTITDRPVWVGFTYAGTVLIGGQLVLITTVVNGYTADETVQGLALLSLGVAAGATLWSLTAAFDHTNTRIGAILLGIGSGLTTILMVVFAFSYYGPTAEFVLPIFSL